MGNSITADVGNAFFDLPNGLFFGWWCERSEKWDNYPRETRYRGNFTSLDEARMSLNEHIEGINRSRNLRVWARGLLFHVANTNPRDSEVRIW
jgi:hypothetical protein